MKTAASKPSAGHFHEWRKRVKYHWYHCRLLQEQIAEPARIKALDHLSDLLGDEHDLAVLEEWILLRGRSSPPAQLKKAISEKRARLQEQSLSLGRELFDEKSGKALESLLIH